MGMVISECRRCDLGGAVGAAVVDEHDLVRGCRYREHIARGGDDAADIPRLVMRGYGQADVERRWIRAGIRPLSVGVYATVASARRDVLVCPSLQSTFGFCSTSRSTRRRCRSTV